ncbi:uncharacterized protein J3D65DRAFT_20205 [Phyllosticta citribraziliensis]|uniref:Uncharacterized protein n=1 Tax=Phyllosticta citribraziliensis TaxID=989973 RepID=A0ABR1M983_9PEZI
MSCFPLPSWSGKVVPGSPPSTTMARGTRTFERFAVTATCNTSKHPPEDTQQTKVIGKMMSPYNAFSPRRTLYAIATAEAEKRPRKRKGKPLRTKRAYRHNGAQRRLRLDGGCQRSRRANVDTHRMNEPANHPTFSALILSTCFHTTFALTESTPHELSVPFNHRGDHEESKTVNQRKTPEADGTADEPQRSRSDKLSASSTIPLSFSSRLSDTAPRRAKM